MQQPTSILNTGASMPLLGLGVYDMYNQEAEAAVHSALQIGYRLIDTAAMYQNEKEVGNAIRSSGVPRAEIFLTTKVNTGQMGYDQTLRAFEQSSRLLDCVYIDLYLIHWPVKGLRRQSWQALEKLYNEGRVKAIGVANYLLPFLQELEGYTSITPAVDQIEFTPFLFLEDEYRYCREKGIQLQSYSPLTRGQKFGDPTLVALSEKYNRTPAQILIRWNLQLGVSTIPKSASRQRLQENFDALTFEIEEADMQQLNSLNQNFRVVDDPMAML